MLIDINKIQSIACKKIKFYIGLIREVKGQSEKKN